MESRFLMTGVIASVALHATLLLLLAVGPCRAVRTVLSDEEDGPGATPVATNDVAAAASVQDEPSDESARPQTSPKTPEEPAAESEPGEAWVTYVVKRGDTLSGLVRETGYTLEQVARENGKSVKALAQLKVGQRIKLPRKPRP